MLILTQERTHGQPAEHNRGRCMSFCQIETMVLKANGLVSDSTALKRSK